MDEVDELLLEQELLSPTAASQTIKSFHFRGKISPDKQTQKQKLLASLKANKDELDDSTLEKLLNGETDLLANERVGDDDYLNDEFIISDEIKNFIAESPAKKGCIQAKREPNQDLIDDIEDLVEEELRNEAIKEQKEKLSSHSNEKNMRGGRSSKLSKDNRPSSPEGGSLNLSLNSNEEGFKDESQQMFKELFQTGNKAKEAKFLSKTKSKAELQPAKNKF